MESTKCTYTTEQVFDALYGNISSKPIKQTGKNTIEEGRYYRHDSIIEIIKKMADTNAMSIKDFKNWLSLLNYCVRRKWMSESSIPGGAKLIGDLKNYLYEIIQKSDSYFTQNALYKLIAEIKYFDYRLKHINESKPEEFLSNNVARYAFYDHHSNFDRKEYYKILIIDRANKLYYEEMAPNPLFNPAYSYVFLNDSSFSPFEDVNYYDYGDDCDDNYDDDVYDVEDDDIYDDATILYRALLCECIKNGYQSKATLKSV
ncbi:MAG: hypothetical protein WC201_02765 [Bacilli bacterium]